jgi:hypothetical protein
VGSKGKIKKKDLIDRSMKVSKNGKKVPQLRNGHAIHPLDIANMKSTI